MTRPGMGSKGPEASLESCTDEALFERIRAGSEAHFNVLYDRYFRRVYAFVFQRVRNHADAEELAQESFTVVFRGIASYAGRSTPARLDLRVAKNLVLNHLRRARVQQERIVEAGREPLATTSPHWSYAPR